MKKVLFLLISAIVAMGIMYGCTKNEDVTPQDSNKKTITVYSKVNLIIRVDGDNGSLLGFSGATVNLYKSQSDYEKGINCIATATTNSSGDATFNVESGKTYYFSVKYGNKTNELDKYYIYCSDKSENTQVKTIIAEAVGTIVLNNDATGSDGGQYKFVVTNKTTGYSVTKYVNSGYYLTLEDMPLGSYSVYMEQQDGYTFSATQGTATGTLQNGYKLTISTSSL